jgi:alpha-1,6-mannosyltransferase
MNLAATPLPSPQRPDARLTVLDVTKWFGETSGGVRTFLLEKGEYVRKRPHLRQVLVVPGPRDEIIDTPGVRCYRLRGPRMPMAPQYRFLLATRSLRRIVRHERPDVIEVGSQIFVPWVAFLATRGCEIPLVGFYHGNLERSVCPPEVGRENRRSKMRRAFIRRYVKTVDRLFTARVAASDCLVRDLGWAGVDGITLVPHGVDLATFHPARRQADQRLRVRRSIGLPDDAQVVVYSGRIAPEKRLGDVVHWWPAVERRIGAWLVVMGEGPLKNGLRRECGGRIIWLPFENDRARVADLLAAADVCLAPGPIETFGLSALEAMACGTPVLSIDQGGVAELVGRSRGGATYVLGDHDAFVGALVALMTGDTRRVGARARQYAELEHGWDRVFDELFSLYASLARQ